MGVVPLYASGMSLSAAIVAAAIVVGVVARVALLARQGKQIFPTRHIHTGPATTKPH